MDRRDFIRLTSFAAGALPLRGFGRTWGLAGVVPGAGAAGRADAGGLYTIFQDPAGQYRPFVRWWWNGDRVTAEELLRELDVMKTAGIGGVEINPIKFPGEADAMGIPSLLYLSDEWLDALAAALKGAKEKGIVCDMIVGSGWPYGGEFLSREEQTQMVALGTRDLTGGQKVTISKKELLDSVHPAFVSAYADPLKELFTLRLVPAQLNGLDQVVTLDGQLKDDQLTIEVPEGPHVLYYLVKITGFMAVINGAPGASGPVLNHYDKAAVEKYLDRISDKLTTRLGRLGDYFRAFFTDSIELEGANWCSDMYAQFRQRRGYDLEPWLPFVLFKVGEMGNAVHEAYGAQFGPSLQERVGLVRYDLEMTKRELFEERFIKTFAGWCTKHGVKSRMQAYGMDCDPIASGMMVDIPECETWIWTDAIDDFGTGDYRKGRNYTMINKFVSSSAHLSGRRLISCEEMTNTDDPFHGTLERIKLAGDQSMLSGVTASILHGFNYSPPEAPFPGWVRYGSYFNEHNTWWPYFRLWADYKARLSAVFQQCDMQAAVAVLHPMADMASKYGFQRDPYPNVVYPRYVHKIWEAVHQNGHGCDYVSEEVLGQCTVRGGALVYGRRAYKALLLPEVESITSGTAAVLKKFADGGGKLIFIDKTPHLSAGLQDHARRSARIKDTVDGLLRKHPHTTGVRSIDEEDMVGWFKGLASEFGLVAEVAVSHPVDYVSTLHYSDGTNDLYFFVNYSGTRSNSFEAVFPVGDKEAWCWDAETGGRCLYADGGGAGAGSGSGAGAKNVLTLTLEPAESRLIVFGPGAGGEAAAECRFITKAALKVDETCRVIPEWQVTFHHVDGTVRTVTMEELKAFDAQSEWHGFAGTIEYRGKLVRKGDMVEDGARRIWLDLGHLRDVSEVEINGRVIGVKWYGEHLYEISGDVRAGDNNLTIRVVTTLGNYMKTLQHNLTAHNWTRRSPYYPVGLEGVGVYRE
ncbi:MAG TPA: glycosyl hydrolase [Puia sp.]|nr:glycosyl hydrolase [Puia sp.]